MKRQQLIKLFILCVACANASIIPDSAEYIESSSNVWNVPNRRSVNETAGGDENQEINTEVPLPPSRSLFGSIVFVEEEEIQDETNVKALPIPCLPNETYVEEVGNCVGILTRGHCSDGNWIVLDPETERPKCARHPAECTSKTSRKTARCAQSVLKLRKSGSESLPHSCDPKRGKTLAFTRNGDVTCECKEGWIQWEADEECYEVFSKGPCDDGQYIGLVEVQTLHEDPQRHRRRRRGLLGDGETETDEFYYETRCIVNVCPEGLIPIKLRKLTQSSGNLKPGQETDDPIKCDKIGSERDCPNDHILTINAESLEPECMIFDPLDTRSAFDSIRLLDCLPGRRRNQYNVCTFIVRFGKKLPF